MEDMLRELIKDQLKNDHMVTDDESLELMVAVAYRQAELRDLATILDTIVGTAIEAYIPRLRHERRRR